MVYHVFSSRFGLIDYGLSRSRRRRTIEIRVDENAEVQVRAPHFLTLAQIEEFLRKKAVWLEKNRQAVIKKRRELETRKREDGERFLFLGQRYPCQIRAEAIRSVRVEFHDPEGWTFYMPWQEDEQERSQRMIDALIRWYVSQAKEIFGGRLFHYARIMGLSPVEINVKSQKRIWGSCHHRSQRINLNWQLVLSPMTVIDYVVVHELCHLVHPDHSPRFWKKVRGILPDYAESVKWLKRNHLEIKWLANQSDPGTGQEAAFQEGSRRKGFLEKCLVV